MGVRVLGGTNSTCKGPEVDACPGVGWSGVTCGEQQGSSRIMWRLDGHCEALDFYSEEEKYFKKI